MQIKNMNRIEKRDYKEIKKDILNCLRYINNNNTQFIEFDLVCIHAFSKHSIHNNMSGEDGISFPRPQIFHVVFVCVNTVNV